MSSARPSIAELRAVCQPGSLLERRSGEHWAGRLYMRRLSLHVTRWLVGTRATPNALTFAMIVVGLVAAAAVAWPGILTALVAVVLIQVYLLLDCVDGEVARWKQVSSAGGVYLDRLGHHVVEAAVVVGLGLRAAGGPSTEPSWWIVLGAVGALLVVLGKLETDLVTVARAGAGLSTSAGGEGSGDHRSRVGPVRRLRRVFDLLPVHRLIGAIELSLFVLAVAVVDAVLGTVVGTQVLVAAVAAVALVVALGHPVTILSSDRLK